MNVQEALKIYAERIRAEGGEASEEASQMEWCPRCQKNTMQTASEVTKRDFTELYGVISYSIYWRCSVCNAVTFKQGWQEEI